MIDAAIGRRVLARVEPLGGGLRNSSYVVRVEGLADAFVLRVYEHDRALCQKELDLHALSRRCPRDRPTVVGSGLAPRPAPSPCPPPGCSSAPPRPSRPPAASGGRRSPGSARLAPAARSRKPLPPSVQRSPRSERSNSR